MRHAKRMKMTVVSDQILPFGAGKLTQELFDNVARIQPDAFFYMGNAFEGGAFFQIARDTLGAIPKIIGAIFMGCSTPDYGYGYSLKDIEGWVGVDQFDPRNPATQAFLDRYEARYGERPEHAYCTQGYDWGMCLSEALGMMRPDNPQAWCRALEQVRMMPSVTGSEGTRVSFAPYDHRAYKGSKWVSLSKCENGKIIKVD
jgi:ABC-type branched-subunit amino acid transport system substrate-binding protein